MAAIFGWEIACIPVSGSRKKKHGCRTRSFCTSAYIYVHNDIYGNYTGKLSVSYEQSKQGKWALHTWCKAIWSTEASTMQSFRQQRVHCTFSTYTIQCSSNSPDLPSHKVSPTGSRDRLAAAIPQLASKISTWEISGSHHATNHLTSLNRGHPAKSWSIKGQPRLHKATPITLQSPLTLVCRASVELTFMLASQSSTPSFRKSAAALWKDKCPDAMFDHVSYPKDVLSTYHDAFQRLATFHGTLTQD